MVRDATKFFVMPAFERYIGVDYAGAATADTRLPGLRVFVAEMDAAPHEVRPHTDARRHWTRRDLARWLTATLSAGPPTAAGIDHGFSFPLRYFQQYGLPRDWTDFLREFAERCPARAAGTTIESLRAQLPHGDARWRRIAELRAGAKSVFHFDVPGSVAKSTHAGLPWLYQLREDLGGRVNFWPFDGWQIPCGRSFIAEAYPALYGKRDEIGAALNGLSQDQRDARAIAAWLSQADLSGELTQVLAPPLSAAEKDAARLEGWILGVR